MASQSDARKSKYSYRPQSLATALIGPATVPIGHVEQLLKGHVAYLGLEAVSPETAVAHTERRPLRLDNDPMQPAFHQGAQRHTLFGRQFADLAQQRVGNFDRGLHRNHPSGQPYMGTHIVAK